MEKKIKAAEEEHGIQILDAGTRQTRASRHLEAATTRPARDASFALNGGLDHIDAPTSKSPVPAPAPATLPKDGEDAAAGVEPGSTQGESEGNPDEELPPLRQGQDLQDVKVKEEPSSDGPVFVSERCIKKRKRNEDGPETPTARPIKTEPRGGGSSPEHSLHHCDFNPHESLDLGDVAQMMYTPRKRRGLEEAQQFNQQPLGPKPTLSTSEAGNGEGGRNTARTGFSSVLTPTVNRRFPVEAASNPADKPLDKGLSHGIAVLAEDGGMYKKAINVTLANPKGISPAIKGRLDTLLNSPSPAEDSTSITRSARRLCDPPVTPSEELAIPKPRELPFEKSARQSMRGSNAATPQAPRTPLSERTNTFQKSKPCPQSTKGYRALLRNKPVSELRLDDFKINPQANEGHNFAFSEVVRDKDERACLPGCVDMHCCGKQFRALALSHRPDPPLTAAQRQEEQRLLEEYLGDYAYRLATMTREERSELWVEAKTRELANKYGKHRNRFSRMRSPPGFWNADFPSTQELETDKSEAANRERQTVQERHREAMRPGGRWIFRDE